jgi:hypothetical protein
MTSASHAEGRQFDPGQVYFVFSYELMLGATECLSRHGHCLISLGRASLMLPLWELDEEAERTLLKKPSRASHPENVHINRKAVRWQTFSKCPHQESNLGCRGHNATS